MTVDIVSGDCIKKFDSGHTKAITALSFSQDGKLALSGAHDSLLIVWDVATGHVLQRWDAHSRLITAATWLEVPQAASDRRGAKAKQMGRTLASASMDSSVKVWEQKLTKTYTKRRRIQSAVAGPSTYYELIWVKDWLPSPIMSLAYDPLSYLLSAARADGVAQMFDAHAPNLGLIEVCSFPAHDSPVACIAMSSDVQLMATGAQDRSVRLFKRREVPGAETKQISWLQEPALKGLGHTMGVTWVDFNRDSTRLASCSMDKKVLPASPPPPPPPTPVQAV